MMKVYTCKKCGEDILPGQAFRRSGKNKIHQRPDCVHARSLPAKNPLKPRRGWKESPPPDNSPKLLWSDRRICNFAHPCDYCCGCDHCHSQERDMILTGDEYVREVWRYPAGEYWENRTKLVVIFRHYPSCPLPDCDLMGGLADVIQFRRKSKASSSRLARAA